MEIKLYDDVTLKDGRVGSVCEVWGNGEAFEVDFPRPMQSNPSLMTFDTETIDRSEIIYAYPAKTI